jgi:hypothetical protein
MAPKGAGYSWGPQTRLYQKPIRKPAGITRILQEFWLNDLRILRNSVGGSRFLGSHAEMQVVSAVYRLTADHILGSLVIWPGFRRFGPVFALFCDHHLTRSSPLVALEARNPEITLRGILGHSRHRSCSPQPRLGREHLPLVKGRSRSGLVDTAHW